MISYGSAGMNGGGGRVRKASGLTLAQRMLLELRPQITEQRANRSSVIAHEGDHVSHFLLLLDGWIGLSKALYDGQTQFVDLLLPGDAILMSSSGASAAPFSAEALSDVRYIAFGEEMINGPEPAAARLRSHLVSSVAIRQARMSESLLRIGQGSAEMRISFALLELFVRLEAVGRTDGQKFHLPMNQRQLGQFTGLSNVHVCRTLRRFERNRVITSADHIDIEIVDIGALCDMADIDLDALRAEIVPTLPD